MALSNLFRFSPTPLKNSDLLFLIAKQRRQWVLWKQPSFSMKVKMER